MNFIQNSDPVVMFTTNLLDETGEIQVKVCVVRVKKFNNSVEVTHSKLIYLILGRQSLLFW